MIELKGRHVFVAGGSRGIGRATAVLAGLAGANVSINFRQDDAAAESAVSEIRSMGRKVVSVRGDLSVDGEASRVVTESVKHLGPLHGLVVAAGIFEPSPLQMMTADFWDRTMAVNVRGTFLAVQAAVPHMAPVVGNGVGGSIVIYTSTAGQRGSSDYSAYATSKGAQILFMRSMAKELAPRRIRVNCVAPGWTETDMSRSALDIANREEVIESIPLGRIGRPEDPAAAACFLLSPLSQFITGSTITVDGGFDMRG